MKDLKATFGSMLVSRHVDTRLIIFMAVFALLLVAVPSWLALRDMSDRHAADQVSAEGQRIVKQVEELASALQQLLLDGQTQSLALQALADPAKLGELSQYLSGRIPQVKEALIVSMPLSEVPSR